MELESKNCRNGIILLESGRWLNKDSHLFSTLPAYPPRYSTFVKVVYTGIDNAIPLNLAALFSILFKRRAALIDRYLNTYVHPRSLFLHPQYFLFLSPNLFNSIQIDQFDR